MINSQFSERAFEIYVNHFIISRGYRIYIPSQNREARLGYDGLINNIKGQKFKAFAMQFKIVQKYQRKPACGHCFNFYLHNYNRYRQHNRLVKLNNREEYHSFFLESLIKILPLFLLPSQLF